MNFDAAFDVESGKGSTCLNKKMIGPSVSHKVVI